MNTKEKIELSRQIVEKVGEINDLLKQAKKEGLTAIINPNGCIEDNNGLVNNILSFNLTQVITYANNVDGIIDHVVLDKTKPALLILKEMKKKLDELNELVSEAHSNGLYIDYRSINPLEIVITETITFSL